MENTDLTEKTDVNTDKPWLFQKGQSGNPNGRPKGSRNKASQIAESLLEGDAELLTRKAIELALEGNTTALKLCLDRLVPSLKPTAASITLPDFNPESLPDAARALTVAAADGQIDPDTASTMISALGTVARIDEISDLKSRLEALERSLERSLTP